MVGTVHHMRVGAINSVIQKKEIIFDFHPFLVGKKTGPLPRDELTVTQTKKFVNLCPRRRFSVFLFELKGKLTDGRGTRGNQTVMM